MIHNAYAWLVAHPASALELLAALTLLVRAVYAALARVLAPYPRVRAAVEALAAVSPDLWRALVMVARAVTGYPYPSPIADARDAEIAALRARVAELASDRVTTAPPAPRGSPGRTDVGTVLTIAVVALFVAMSAVVLGSIATGCGPGRELVMRVAPGVPAASSCSPAGASRCEGAVPVVCSASGRWWPATPAGAPCAHGCVVGDGGAYCAAADGGAR